MPPLRVLHIEDSEDDAALVLRELRRVAEEVTVERVETAEALKHALDHGTWQVVICDYSLPRFSAAEALQLVQERGLDIPFIIVSGTIGEETAVSMMKAGAHDYLMKSSLRRLSAAVQREVHEAFLRAERNHAQAALLASETKYRRIIETSYEGILTINREARVDFANARLATMLGYTTDELLGRPLLDFVDKTTGEQFIKTLWGNAEQRELRFVRKNGSTIWALVSLSPILDEKQTNATVLLMVSDITDRKHLEEQFRQAQKMEAVGRLAGGVAHDFNNLLTVILSYSALLQRHFKPGDPLREDMREIERAGERASALTRQLLTFSRRQVLQIKVVDLNDIISNMEKMLRRLIGEDVTLFTQAGSTLAKVDADPGQIEQLIMNLAVNARDAMPNGGKLTLETANVELDEAFAHDHLGVVPGRYVMLAVTDSGSGMDKATQARIFEPFFTTKSQGKGTGLGLSTVFGIAKQCGGSVWVYSELGEGTTFKIYLPVSSHVEKTPSAEPASEPVLHGTETILLTEDEDAVRNVTRTVLVKHGYHVLEARNGGEAFLLCEQHKAPIDLLLTDVVMPQMSGRQLAERLTLLRPQMKVLYMSGYPDHAIVQHGVLDSGIHYIQKPLTPDKLLRKVREVLQSGIYGTQARV